MYGSEGEEINYQPLLLIMVLSDLNVGIFCLFAISSLGVYGIIMASWSSNSKYVFFKEHYDL